MATHLMRPTNGVSFGIKHTVTAADIVDGSVTLDFQVDYDLVASVMLTSSSGVANAVSDFSLTYPAAGQVKVDVSSEFLSGEILHVVANRDYNSDNPY